MKSFFSIILILIFSQKAFCQKKYKLNFGDTTYFACDTMEDSGFIFCDLKKEQKKDGIYSIMKNGRMYEEFTIQNGALNGMFKSYESNGLLSYESFYKNDTIFEHWQYWYYDKKYEKVRVQIQWHELYTYDYEGNESIEFTYYDNWGRRELHGYYLNDKKHGEWNVYNLEGDKIIATVHFNDGKAVKKDDDYELFKEKFRIHGYVSVDE